MSLPDQTPKLPKLPFLVGDAVLVGAAWYIAYRDAGPLTVQAMAAVTVCVVLAAILGAVPFLADYARRQDEALDERQRGLEALSRTISTAAEQISIAANGLNELTDLTHKNLKQADQLPHKLQEKIAEFNAQLDNARENDREELEKEVAELRTSEIDRLQSVSEKVHKTVAELGRLEASLQQHVNRRTEETERANATFSKTHAEATKALHDAQASFTRELASAQSKAIAEIDQKLVELAAAAQSMIGNATRPSTPAISASIPATIPAAAVPAAESSATSPVLAETTPDAISPPKRPRKARREDERPAIAPTQPEPPTAVPAGDIALPTSSTPPIFAEPAPIPAETIAQIEPIAPDSGTPFPEQGSATPPASAQVAAAPQSPTVNESAVEASVAITPPPANPSESPARKRTPPRKAAPEPAVDSSFQLVSEELPHFDDTAGSGSEMEESVISSDGATRLIATSYIGIGNRLFIRGEGPGLSWDRGVPLQFISIGKWRWETNDANSPISFKIYKNDEVECAGLGARVLEPGRQQEVTAKF